MDIKKECKQRGWVLLNEIPALDCDENAWELHCEESARILDKMQQDAEAEDGLWRVSVSYIDHAHKDRRTRCEFVEPCELQDLIEGADLKNGIDIAHDEKGTIFVIANGQGYVADGIHGIVTTLFECRLLKGVDAELARERM